jgi:hypothetical protein
MNKSCPVCQAECKDTADFCLNEVCGWRFIQLLSDSPSEKKAYMAKLAEAKLSYRTKTKISKETKNPNLKVIDEKLNKQAPRLGRDVFETMNEFRDRLIKQSWHAGDASLKKKNYNINTGIFTIDLEWKSWMKSFVYPNIGQVFLERNAAKAVYEGGPVYPIYVDLSVNSMGTVKIIKIFLKTLAQDFDIETENSNRKKRLSHSKTNNQGAANRPSMQEISLPDSKNSIYKTVCNDRPVNSNHKRGVYYWIINAIIPMLLLTLIYFYWKDLVGAFSDIIFNFGQHSMYEQ